MMSTISLLTNTAIALLAAPASAFYGQLSDNTVCAGEGCNPIVGLVDYNTGSTYTCGVAYASFCTYEGRCPVYCQETSPGGYNFNAQFWVTSDGCANIDFEGALSAGHGWCCGGMPCDLTA